MYTHIQRHIKVTEVLQSQGCFWGHSDWRIMNSSDSDIMKFPQCLVRHQPHASGVQWAPVPLLPLEGSGRYWHITHPCPCQKLQPPPALRGHFGTLVQLGTFMAKQAAGTKTGFHFSRFNDKLIEIPPTFPFHFFPSSSSSCILKFSCQNHRVPSH